MNETGVVEGMNETGVPDVNYYRPKLVPLVMVMRCGNKLCGARLCLYEHGDKPELPNFCSSCGAGVVDP